MAVAPLDAPPEPAFARLAELAARLRAAEPEQMYAVYLDERPSYTGSTAFFLDAADLFLERGQPQLALRILSNLAEMDLENRHILRILAYRLLQASKLNTSEALAAIREKVASGEFGERVAYLAEFIARSERGIIK